MTPLGGRKAVLAVYIPGRSPYAVVESRFKRPSRKTEIAGAGLPALVSTTDPNEIEILWDEVPSLDDQVAQRISDSLQGQEARMEGAKQMQLQMLEAAQGAGADPTAAGTPPAAAIEMMAQNAKQTLAYVKDPAMRKMLIEQYRAAGVQLDAEDEAP